MTKDALNHRFRRLRAEALIITEARQQGLDMKNLDTGDSLPAAQRDIDKASMPTIPHHKEFPIVFSEQITG
jgi:hypothetical protein